MAKFITFETFDIKPAYFRVDRIDAVSGEGDESLILIGGKIYRVRERYETILAEIEEASKP